VRGVRGAVAGGLDGGLVSRWAAQGVGKLGEEESLEVEDKGELSVFDPAVQKIE